MTLILRLAVCGVARNPSLWSRSIPVRIGTTTHPTSNKKGEVGAKAPAFFWPTLSTYISRRLLIEERDRERERSSRSLSGIGDIGDIGGIGGIGGGK